MFPDRLIDHPPERKSRESAGDYTRRILEAAARLTNFEADSR